MLNKDGQDGQDIYASTGRLEMDNWSGSLYVKKYWYIFRLVWIEQMAYRVNFFLEIGSVMVSSVIVVLLWLAVYRSAHQESIGGYSPGEMVTYLLGGGFINSFLLTTAENPETSQSIQEGTLSNLLAQPMHPYSVWLLRDLGTKGFLVVLGVIGYGVVSLFFREYLRPPSSAWMVGLLLVALLLAALLQFLLFEALSLLAFWVENTYGIRFTMRVIMAVAGGALIPLALFPAGVRAVLEWLPFYFLLYFPMQIYLGKIAPHEIAPGFGKELIWIAGLALANWMIWKRGIRHYVAMGD
jgi:ABC-2 type transport system permease protein